MTTMMMTVWW